MANDVKLENDEKTKENEESLKPKKSNGKKRESEVTTETKESDSFERENNPSKIVDEQESKGDESQSSEKEKESNKKNIGKDEEVLDWENDELIEKDYLSSLLQQKDRLIYYEVENIYKDEKKRLYRNKLNLKKDPPVLIIRDEEENEVKFYLTENLTDELHETLRQVKRAYYGFSGPSDINMPKGFLNKVKYYIKNNPLKIVGGVIIVGFLITLNL